MRSCGKGKNAHISTIVKAAGTHLAHGSSADDLGTPSDDTDHDERLEDDSSVVSESGADVQMIIKCALEIEDDLEDAAVIIEPDTAQFQPVQLDVSAEPDASTHTLRSRNIVYNFEPPNRPKFLVKSPGIAVPSSPVGNCGTALDFLEMFWTPAIAQRFRLNSNSYGVNKGTNPNMSLDKGPVMAFFLPRCSFWE